MASTQAALYGELSEELHLSWSEAELPERERTKHVHRLHPYLGKFVPQLVEALLDRYVKPGGRVLDPFAGSGTTLVQCLESDYDAVGIDVAAFNCLLMRVKTTRYDLLPARDRVARRSRAASGGRAPVRAGTSASGSLRRRRPSSSTSARSSTTTSTPTSCVWCSHARRGRRGSPRTSTSTSRARPSASRTGATSTAASARRCRRPSKFLARYLLDTLERIKAFQSVRARGSELRSSCTATRPRSSLDGAFDAIVTSPPYPGLIDYHEQHRYAYELLGLDDRRDRELGAAARGTSRRAVEEYVDGIVGRLCAATASRSRPMPR